jgi:putative DNA primase/helicase
MMDASHDPVAAHAAAAMDRGWMIFPVSGKNPLPGTRGFYDATRDFDVVGELWPEGTRWGIALATGKPSNVFILDLDGPEGMAGFRELQERHGRLLPTVTAHTSRGFHLYLRMPEEGDVRNSASRVAPGVDVRGTGGYVVMPPSPHPDGGTYRWARGRGPDDLVPIEPPAWILQAVRPRPAPPRTLPTPPTSDARGLWRIVEEECGFVAHAPEGTRNDQLNRSAFALARFVATGELDATDVARRLAFAAARAGLPSREIERTIVSAFSGRGVAA